MVLEEGEILTLNEQEYIVVHVIDYLNEQYAYLISNFKPIDIIVAKVKIDNENLLIDEVEDESTLKEILRIVGNAE